MPTYPQGAVDINSAQAAERAVGEVAQSAQVAVDLEADALHAFRPKLCFIQVATDRQVFLFDTLAPGVRPELLSGVLTDALRTKFLHAAMGDVQYLAESGIRLKGLFDTHRAATLLGWQKVGLADLARERLGVELPKAHQQSDFSLRPLPKEMRDYIADDVRYLCEIGRQVREECRKADILEEVELDCQRLADEASSRPEIGSDYKPKLRSTSLSPTERRLGMALADELHRRRLKWAKEADVPFGRILSNSAISELASKPPTTLKQLIKTPFVRGPLARQHGEEILNLIEALRAKLLRGELAAEPEVKPKRDPLVRKREEALRAFRAQKASQRKVVPSVVLSNSLLTELSANPPRSLGELERTPYFGEKRVGLYGEELLALFTQIAAGKRKAYFL